MTADRAEYDKDWLIVKYDPAKISQDQLLQTVKKMEFEPKIVSH